MNKNKRPLIGISACLLGEAVRYNKGNTADRWIIRELSKFVDFYPVCPEVAMGLGTPREEIHLYYSKEGEVKLRSKKTREELTPLAKETYKEMNKGIEDKGLDGFILMRKSPSCGLGNVKTVSEDEQGPVKRSVGLFASNIEENFPMIPKIDSGRLKNEELRENFIKSVYAHFRLKNLEPQKSALQDFHMRYKYILMGHCQDSLRELGKIAANHERKCPQKVYKEYRPKFFKALSKQPTVKNRVNTLQHLIGYFKNYLSSPEKSEILNLIDEYKTNVQNYMVPVTIINFLTKKYEITYLQEQYLFAPYPKDLKLHRAL